MAQIKGTEIGDTSTTKIAVPLKTTPVIKQGTPQAPSPQYTQPIVNPVMMNYNAGANFDVQPNNTEAGIAIAQQKIADEQVAKQTVTDTATKLAVTPTGVPKTGDTSTTVLPTGTGVQKSTKTTAPVTLPTVTPTTKTAQTTTTTQNAYQEQQNALTEKLLEALNKPNQYLDTLNNMKFEYDPQSDPEYLRDAAGLETQVANMMVGRGGLYSSVASSALQSRLVSMQIDYIKNKRNEFNEQRNFALTMAKFEADQMSKYFNQVMSIKQNASDEDTKAFNQNFKLTEFAAQQAMDDWTKAYKTAEFNNDIYYKNQALAMDRERLEIQRANAIADAQQAQAKQKLALRAKNLQTSIALYTEERKKLDTAIAKLPNIPQMMLNGYTSTLQKAEAELNAAEQRIKTEALTIGQYQETLDMLHAIRQEPAPLKIGTQTSVSGVNDTGEYSYTSTTTPIYNNTRTTPVITPAPKETVVGDEGTALAANMAKYGSASTVNKYGKQGTK